MAEEEPNHEDNMRTLAVAQTVDNAYKTYRRNLSKEEESIVEPLTALERIVSNGDEILEGSFMKATPQAIEFATRGYQEANKKAREKAVKESGNYIANQYTSIVNKVLEEIVEKISSDEEFKKLEKEDQDKIIRPELYVQIDRLLKELKPNEKELDDDEKGLVTLSSASDEGERRKATDSYLRARESSYMKYVVDPLQASQRASSRLGRILAKKILKRNEEGRYIIDREIFSKLYGTEENYKKIALTLLATK